MSWIIVGLVLLAITLFVKASNKGQNFWSYVIVVAALFFVLTIVYVSTLPGVSLTSLDGVMRLGKLYFTWLGQFFKNVATLTGNAVKLDWGANFTGD